ncbi:hypothetical protein OJF2_45370 [Aquisphaera giovannonii]|uniref:MoxR-vWA-beta-propeller ternary system domain-containing protein n=1 Tax=Aquisphaera giovannonii TaxID=406548 RepID=A0A5B9W768_9BACT|nr:tetratricopeptide repeat protein [Aquisphaera giovannonii]QEH35979.1 hypothetical protein OJF2_45370 [Aquisphaera giovannonii]
MRVPFQVRRRPDAGPADAAFFAGRDPAPLLALCAGLGLDPGGRVHGLADGLLLKLGTPAGGPLPGALRLRAIAPDLFLPADAELVPALLDDEAKGLTRDRGLVFLPGGRALAYDPRRPIPLAAMLTAGVLPRRDWQPLPARPALADRIASILVDFPDETPESALDAGSGGDVGSEGMPQGPASPDAPKAGASGLARLRDMASSLLRGAIGRARGEGSREGAEATAPDAGLVARQAAALRDLLREFREGDVEKALRRSIPASSPGELRGAGGHGGDRLPDRDLKYRLEDLLGGKGGSGGEAWLGGGDLMAALLAEYRKAAQEATRRGDHRRAAAIYGKLLRDDRAAVQALLRGGLYHDAGVLLLARLDDRRGAARAFASAGEADRAVALYREIGDHEAAGDLLRGIGEEEAALAEYQTAADQLAAHPGGHLAAGSLLLKKAGRADLAMEQFAEGWRRRPVANAVPCAVEAARLLAARGDVPALRSLLDEADAFFAAAPGAAEPGRFYNAVATFGDGEGLGQARGELRDRALLGLAAVLRRRIAAGEKAPPLVSSLLGGSGSWPAAVVSDASHAATAPRRQRRDGPSSVAGAGPRLRVCSGTVTAASGASESGDVVLGTATGEVWAFRPETSEVVAVSSYDLPVAALASDPTGELLVVLRSHPGGRGAISSYARRPDGRYEVLAGTTMEALSSPWLTPVLRTAIESLVGLWDGESFQVLSVGSLTSWGTLHLPAGEAPPPPGLLLDSEGGEDGEFDVLTHDGREWCRVDPWGGSLRPTGLQWRPEPRGDALRSLTPSWIAAADGGLELAGPGEDGSLHWGRLQDGQLIARNASPGPADGGYLAAAVVREGVVAGVSRSRVDWVRCGARAFQSWRATPEPIPAAVAAFPSRPTGELIVVARDGLVVRLPIPG